MQLRQSTINRLVLQQKDIQRELSEAQEQGDSSGLSEEMAKGLEGKLQTIETRLGLLSAHTISSQRTQEA